MLGIASLIRRADHETRYDFAPFGEPPTDIWPPASVRFSSDRGYVRVNVKQNLVLSKAHLRLLAEIGAAAVLVAIVVAVY